MTRFVTFPAGFTCIAPSVFKIEAGDLVDMLDGDDAVDPAAVMVGDCFGPDPSQFKQKSEIDARLQLCVFGLVSELKRSFLRSWKRAPTAPLVAVAPPILHFA